VSSLHVRPIKDLVDLNLDVSHPDPIERFVLEPSKQMRLILLVSGAKGRPLERETFEEDL